MSNSKLSRRDLIRKGFKASALGLILGGAAKGDVCTTTPRQGEGPFYPENDLNRDYDLTQINVGDPEAQGEKIFVRGVVQDRDCRPIRNAMVEIWQAALSGKYNHSLDTSPLKLDPHFQYWGRTRTDADGRYEFKTIIPGHYPVGVNRYRPPHIHFKAHAAGFFSLTTQMYFDPASYDDPQLAALVTQLNQAESVDSRLKVLFEAEVEGDLKAGEFPITLISNR